jgi:hypothetical protein
MDKIIIGFSTSKKKNLFSSIIKYVDNTPYSHVYCKFRSNSLDRDFVYHAARSFVHFYSMENFAKKNITFYEFEICITQDQKTKLMQMCIDKAGLQYGLWSVIGIGLVKFLKNFKINTSNPFKDGSKTYFCSELVSSLLQELGLDTNTNNSEEDGVKWLYKILKQESLAPHAIVFERSVINQ